MRFCLHFSNADVPDEMAEKLYEFSQGDATLYQRNGAAFADFDRRRYTALLESADPGEPPQQGGELYAEVGKGRYVYTAYAWFRQLPAGVPGAYRQFANLISLSKAPR